MENAPVNLISSIEGLETCLRENIVKLSGYPHAETKDQYTCYEEIVKYVENFIEFVERVTEEIYGRIVLVSNVLEDGLRTIYISSEDATLESFATELETQLSQLRLLTEGLKELPGQTNEEFGEILTNWSQVSKTLYKNLEYGEKFLNSFEDRLPSGVQTIDPLKKATLIRPCHYVVKTGLKTLTESCMKILSVLSMISGKWEQKIEQRIDAEDINEGMIMTSGRKIRRGKKNRVSRSSDLYY